MTMKVYSVGYEYAGAQAYVKQLLSDPSVLLIDTRKSPKTWRADWTKEVLQQDYPAQYHWAGAYLGNRNYHTPGLPIDIVDPVVGIRGLIMYLREGHDLILLCKCQDYAVCHRRVIAELLQAQLPDVDIEVYRPKPDVETMKCLSIRQPWCHFIASRLKDIENRDWNTKYRGPVLLYAGVKTESSCFDRSELSDAMIARYQLLAYDVPLRKKEYVTGAIIGVAELVDVVTKSESRWFVGEYGFVFERARLFKAPVPYAGQLNFFDVPLSVVSDALKQVEDVAAVEAKQPTLF